MKQSGCGAFNHAAGCFSGAARDDATGRRNGVVKDFNLENSMSEKSVIILPPIPKHVCPICGKASYSLGGIHPQCAIQQADAKRMVKVRAEQAAMPKIKKPVQKSWQKKCPQCERQSHVRLKTCACGHQFA